MNYVEVITDLPGGVGTLVFLEDVRRTLYPIKTSITNSIKFSEISSKICEAVVYLAG